MSVEGFNYFYNDLGLQSGAYKIFYDMRSGGNIIPSLPLANPSYSGIFSSNFFGTFTGQNLEIKNSTDLASDSWTMFFVFARSGVKDGILFSNYHGNNPSGFVIGVDSRERLYLESYGQNGPTFYTSSNSLFSKNAVAINKNYNNISINYFDCASSGVVSDVFSTNNAFNYNSGWNIGNAINPPPFFSGNSFNGSIDYYAYVNTGLFPYEITKLFSGLLIDKVPGYHYDILSSTEKVTTLGLNSPYNFKNISLKGIGDLSYSIQTGILLGNTGVAVSTLTGQISNQAAIVSGSVTGYVSIPSGYNNTGIISYSGTTTNVLGSGIRVFENSIISGTYGQHIPFDNPLDSAPVISTQLQGGATATPQGYGLDYNIYNVSNTGFDISFYQKTTSGMSLLVAASQPQNGLLLKSNKVTLGSGVSTQDILFPSIFLSGATPLIYSRIIANTGTTGQKSVDYLTKNITSSGFSISFTPGHSPSSNNYFLEYMAMPIQDSDTFFNNSYTGTPTQTSIFVPFKKNLTYTPLVLIDYKSPLLTAYRNVHTISNVSTSGFNLKFSSGALYGVTVEFDYMAWKSEQSGVSYLMDTFSGMAYMGQFLDESKNTTNISGFENYQKLVKHDVSFNLTSTVTGSNQVVDSGVAIIKSGFSYPVSFTLSGLNTGMSNFVYTSTFSNSGQNFFDINSTVYYQNPDIQTNPFYIFKKAKQSFGLVKDTVSLNNDYMKDFSYANVIFTDAANSGSFVETYKYLTPNINNLNIGLSYSKQANSVLLGNLYQNANSLNIYVNGSGLLNNIDYTISGASAYLNFSGDSSYPCICDNINGARYLYQFNNLPLISGSYIISGVNSIQNDFYNNGKKLIKGFDYSTGNLSGNSVIQFNTGYSGHLYTMPLCNMGSFASGDGNFYNKQSQVWMNGLRQTKNVDYFEVSKFNLLSGTKNTVIQDIVLTNTDNGLFWE
jgi:hypothetical protein